MIDKKELFDFLREEDILAILKDYGVTPVKITNKEMWFETICHGGDSHKLCYFRKDKDFYCYTNCGKMSFFTLFMKISNCDFYTSLKKIASAVCFKGSFHEDNPIDKDLDFLNKQLLLKNKNDDMSTVILSPIDDKILDYFDSNTFFEGWINEGISIETLRKFHIEWYEIGRFIIIPHYDVNGKLIGIRRRIIRPEEKEVKNKYMPLIKTSLGNYAHSLGANLYGLDKVKDSIKKSKRVIIVEAEKSVMLSDTFFNEDNVTVATCGFNVTETQRRLLLALSPEEVILGFDKDFDPLECENLEDDDPLYKQYVTYVKKIKEIGKGFLPFCRVSVLWDEEELLEKKDSPFDKGKETFLKLMDKRKPILFEE